MRRDQGVRVSARRDQIVASRIRCADQPARVGRGRAAIVGEREPTRADVEAFVRYPGVLLAPSPGKATRVSVVSFVGLSADGPAHFVSRLQASQFSWFRAHPELGGLLVMDEAQNF